MVSGRHSLPTFNLGQNIGCGFGLLSLRVEELGEGEGGGCGHDRGGQQVRGGDPEADVGRQHAARDGGEAPRHHGVDLGLGHPRQEGFDEERRLGLDQSGASIACADQSEDSIHLAKEDVTRSVHGLAGGGAHGHLDQSQLSIVWTVDQSRGSIVVTCSSQPSLDTSQVIVPRWNRMETMKLKK